MSFSMIEDIKNLTCQAVVSTDAKPIVCIPADSDFIRSYMVFITFYLITDPI